MKTFQALRSLNPYIWRYKSRLVWGGVFVILSNFFGVFAPIFVRNAIDTAGELFTLYNLHEGFWMQDRLAGMITLSLMSYAGLVVLAALLRGVFLFFTRQTLIVMSRKVEFDLRNDLYNHYQSLSLSFFRRNKTGDLMARSTEDIGRVRMYLGPGIMYTFNTISLIVIVVIAMLMVNVKLTLFALIPLPILSVSIYLLESVIQRKGDRIQSQLSKLTAFTQEIFSGIRVVKAYVRENEKADQFEKESEEYKQRSMDLAKLNSLFFPLVMVLVGLSNILVIWVGGLSVIRGEISLGNVAEFIMYINILAWPIIAVGWVTTLIQRAAASQIRIDELMNQHSEIKFPESGPTIEKAHLVFENVSFTYPDTGIQALKDISFEVMPGEKLGILGATGSGKSTIVNLIPRLIDADSGNILINGNPIESFTAEGLRREIGYAPQDVFLFSETISGNIAFGLPGADRDKVEEAASKSAIRENILEFAEGFETMVGERGVTLSGGQKQRSALARAWIRDPKLLILDDSLSAVDTGTEESILKNLRDARQKDPDMAVIMVSHRVSTLQDADKIIVIEDGQVLEQGSHAELIKKEGLYFRTHQKQLIESEISL